MIARPWFGIGIIAGTIMLGGAAVHGGHGSTPGEVARLRAHFESVLAELRSADIASLDPARRHARATLIHRLEEYAAGGRFPHNHVDATRPVSIFRDDHGTLCAMGYLIASTGHTEIVDVVVGSANLERIPSLAAEPRLVAWLDSVGLTVAEAARIQPMYFPDPCSGCRLDNNDHKRVRYVGFSLGMTAINGTLSAAVLNPGTRVSSRTARIVSWLGVIGGSAQLIYGASAMRPDDPRRPYGYVNLVLGPAAIGASVWRLRHPLPETAATTALRVGPLLSPGRAGVVLSARM